VLIHISGQDWNLFLMLVLVTQGVSRPQALPLDQKHSMSVSSTRLSKKPSKIKFT
jgi:hypothetical protein